MKTAGATARLEQFRDGLDGVDLGVIGLFQFALAWNGSVLAVYRRRASEVGTYGGWRWECSAAHPANYPTLPERAELAKRIGAALRAAGAAR